MNANYVLWQFKSVDEACVLKDITGIDQQYRLNDGTPLAREFPANVSFHMDPDYPTDLLLVDNLLNADMLIVASTRLKEFLEARHLEKIEYLPVHIIDHKGRDTGGDYFIVHPVEPVACVDENASVFERDFLMPDAYSSFEQLVLDESRIPPGREIFRLQGFWDLTLVRRDLAEALEKEGFSGLGWLELSEYPQI